MLAAINIDAARIVSVGFGFLASARRSTPRFLLSYSVMILFSEVGVDDLERRRRTRGDFARIGNRVAPIAVKPRMLAGNDKPRPAFALNANSKRAARRKLNYGRAHEDLPRNSSCASSQRSA